MTKEDQIIEMIGEVAVQATQQNIDLEQRLTFKIDGVERRLEARIDALDVKMDKMRDENLAFHDEIVGYLKRAEQERVFTSEHLKRLDREVEELRRVR